MKLNAKALAITLGLVWGIGLFIITWWVIAFVGATGASTALGAVYIGYNISPVGSIIGLVYGSVNGLIGGFIIAWLYNLLVDRLS